MIQVAELFTRLTQSDVPSIRRINLRKLCRSLGLPACGVSFWTVEDLNWDYLCHLNDRLTHEKFWFQGGEAFPRIFLDNYFLGQDRRTEFIFLCTRPQHHRIWRYFFETRFGDVARDFGKPTPACTPQGDETRWLLGFFRNALMTDLIHYSDRDDQDLVRIGDFFLCLSLLTLLQNPQGLTRDEIFTAFKAEQPRFRTDLSRIVTTLEMEPRLDDILYLLGRLT